MALAHQILMFVASCYLDQYAIFVAGCGAVAIGLWQIRGTHIDRQAAASASTLPDGPAARRSEWHTCSCPQAAPGNGHASAIADAAGNLANWGRVQRSGCCHKEPAPPRSRGREALVSQHLKNLAGRLCWGIEMLPASELDKSIQHDSRCANVPNCTRRADLRFDCGAPQQPPAIAPRARHFRHRRL